MNEDSKPAAIITQKEEYSSSSNESKIDRKKQFMYKHPHYIPVGGGKKQRWEFESDDDRGFLNQFLDSDSSDSDVSIKMICKQCKHTIKEEETATKCYKCRCILHEKCRYNPNIYSEKQGIYCQECYIIAYEELKLINIRSKPQPIKFQAVQGATTNDDNIDQSNDYKHIIGLTKINPSSNEGQRLVVEHGEGIYYWPLFDEDMDGPTYPYKGN